MITIHQQIDYLNDQLKHMRADLPIAVANGRITDEHATYRMAYASAILQTLTQLRGLVMPGAKA